jgi:DDE superfamily endonuclease
MENGDDSDDSSIEEMRRRCRHARKFIDGSLSNFFDEEDESNEDLVLPRTREVKWIHQRLVWSSHLRLLQHENLFKRTYRMSLEAFNKLKGLLGDKVKVRPERSPVLENITPEIVMAIGLRYLSGGKCLDLKNVYGLSLASVYRVRDMFIDAVNSCPELVSTIRMPETIDEMREVAQGFEQYSTSQLIRGCIGCIDGYLATTTKPTMKDSNNNPRAYYSGHYGVYGLNVQAVCDKQSRFIFFGVVAPGKCGDQVAFERTPLWHYIRHLPAGYFLIGDAAYSVGESMLTPFTGGHRNDPIKDAFNFFLSQLRIRIEMAFGLLTNKWRILHSPLQTNLPRCSDILMACARLHNYCIDEDGGTDLSNDEALTFIQRMPPVNNAPFGWPFLPTVETYRSISGTSMTRDMLLRRVEQQGMRRPNANLERRRYELHEVGLM